MKEGKITEAIIEGVKTKYTSERALLGVYSTE